MNDRDNDTIIGLIIYRGRPFLRKSELAQYMGCSKAKITYLIKGVQKQIEAGRYSGYVISGDLYNVAAFLDYNKFRDALDDPVRQKYVPPFAPGEIAELIGNVQRQVAV